jgi:hypothetical protein
MRRWGIRDVVRGGVVRAYDLATAQHAVNQDPARLELMVDHGYGWRPVADWMLMDLWGPGSPAPALPRRLGRLELWSAWWRVEGAGVCRGRVKGVRRLCVGMGRVIGRLLAGGRQPFKRNNG